jgi:segregation and condensation protein A
MDASMTDTQKTPSELQDGHDTGYEVHLDVFQGPLDLLLYLIEREQMDITTVSLAAVTDQYLEHLKHGDGISADHLAGFLVVAAKLLLIKSRALLPVPVQSEPEEEDVGDELVRQLEEYRRLRDLADQLRSRELEGLRAYLRLAPVPRLERPLDLGSVSLDDLLEALQEALALGPEAEPVGQVVASEKVSIQDRVQAILTMLSKGQSFVLQDLLQRSSSRTEIVVTFLALLALVKSQRVAVRQEHLFGKIVVSPAALSSDDAQPPP